MWPMPVIAMHPFRQVRGTFTRMSIGPSIDPFSQRGLDEALGFAVGARSVELGEDMPQAPTSTDRGKRQRAKHLGIVGHDAAYPYTQRGVVAHGVIEERRRAAL